MPESQKNNLAADSNDTADKLDNKIDYACFAIWEQGLQKAQEISDDLRESFEVIGDYLIYWSEENYQTNIKRLYGKPNYNPDAKHKLSGKIGKPPFRFLIVRDKNPSYAWKQSVSGAIEPTNKNIVAAKYKYRSWFEKEYQVHSSNNYTEFLYQTALILGAETTKKLQATTTETKQTIKLNKDLEGANGWANWQQMFAVLNLCSNYLVLRNFESLPELLDDADIDFLTDHFQGLASAANIIQSEKRPYKGKISVGNQNYSTDIRFLGDGYYPTSWEKDLLSNKDFNGVFSQPALEDYFFTLLYHCKVHKEVVKDSYVKKLSTFAKELDLDWFDANQLQNDRYVGELLQGYMSANAYFYEPPFDKGVGEKTAVIMHLPKVTDIGAKKSRKKKKLLRKIGKLLRKIRAFFQ